VTVWLYNYLSSLFTKGRRNSIGVMGGDLGDWGNGRLPQISGGGTAHASVPSIFWEVVLSDARESMNRVKKYGGIKKLFTKIGGVLLKKGSYTIFDRVKIMENLRKR